MGYRTTTVEGDDAPQDIASVELSLVTDQPGTDAQVCLKRMVFRVTKSDAEVLPSLEPISEEDVLDE